MPVLTGGHFLSLTDIESGLLRLNSPAPCVILRVHGPVLQQLLLLLLLPPPRGRAPILTRR